MLGKIWEKLGDRKEKAIFISVPIPGKKDEYVIPLHPKSSQAFIHAPDLDTLLEKVPEMAAIDIFPSLIGMLGHKVRKTFDGKDLSGQLSKKKTEANRKLFWETAGFRIVKQEKWKLVIDPSQNVFLYDLEEDPGTQNNLSIKESEKALELMQAHQQWKESVRD